MNNITDKNQHPFDAEDLYEEETLVFQDGSSILSINRAGDKIDLGKSGHKYFKNPADAPSVSVAIAGTDAAGNKVNMVAVHNYGVLKQKDRQGGVRTEVIDLHVDPWDFSGEITIGEPFTFASGEQLANVSSIAAWYKNGANGREIPGENPFVAARASIEEKLRRA